MLKVKVRFTGKKEEIDMIIDYMLNFMDDNNTYKVLYPSEVSGFYPNRGSSTEGRVYCDMIYDEEIYHGKEE